jgi:hypothetical protein
LRISVRVHNGSTTPLRLDDVAVTMSYGGARTPASPVDDPSAAELHGALAPGGSADGRYLFTVPADDRGAVTVTVGYQADAPFLVFTGRA